MLLAPVVRDQKGEFRTWSSDLAREGLSARASMVKWWKLAANTRIKLDPKARHSIDVIVDRLVIDEKIASA